MQNKFFRVTLILWLISLVAFGIVAKLASEKIEELERIDMEKRK